MPDLSQPGAHTLPTVLPPPLRAAPAPNLAPPASVLRRAPEPFLLPAPSYAITRWPGWVERAGSTATFVPLLVVPCIVGLDASLRFAWTLAHQEIASVVLALWTLWSFFLTVNPPMLYAGIDPPALQFPPRSWAAFANLVMGLVMLGWLSFRFGR